MKNLFLLKKMWLGALAGYAYYYFVGCVSGTCAITSNPINSTVYGLIMGALLFTLFEKEQQHNQKENKES